MSTRRLREADSQDYGTQTVYFLRELYGFPLNLLQENWHSLAKLIEDPRILETISSDQILRGGKMTTQDKHLLPSTRWQALIGVVPFFAFGLVVMIGKMDQFSQVPADLIDMIFYLLVLSGFLVGWIRGFPLWSYGYLGWALLAAWLNTNSMIFGFKQGHSIWIPFGVVILIALVWTRTFDPVKILMRDIWNDWTRLTFVMYCLAAFMCLIYDENHHPYLLLLIGATILIVTAGAWFFLRSSNILGRILSVVVSCFAASIPMAISYLTWDWRAYFGLPTAETWYDNLGMAPMGYLFLLMILFWPALIGLIQRFTSHQTSNA
ncbi:MAG: hypothetical protein ACK2UM_16340 [Anaerolineales bacterium]